MVPCRRVLNPSAARPDGLRTNPVSAGEVMCLAVLLDRKSTRLNSSHLGISYAVFCLKKKIETEVQLRVEQEMDHCFEAKVQRRAEDADPYLLEIVADEGLKREGG